MTDAHRIAFEALDLDHVGAPIAERRRARRHEAVLREVDDLDAGERKVHRTPYSDVVPIGDVERGVERGDALVDLGLADGAGRHEVHAIEVHERPHAPRPHRARELGHRLRASSPDALYGTSGSRVVRLRTSSTAQNTPSPRTSPTDG